MYSFNFIQILSAAVIATALMTAFSYIVSESFKKLFKEPVLLAYFLNRLGINASRTTVTVLAWTLHFLIGFIFVTIYHFVWQTELLTFNWQSSLVLGAISGVVGIIHWFAIFIYTRHHPRIPFTAYYIQLFFAHLIFGIAAYKAYQFF